MQKAKILAYGDFGGHCAMVKVFFKLFLVNLEQNAMVLKTVGMTMMCGPIIFAINFDATVDE